MKLSEGFDFTQSNLKDYLDCPYRFYMKYIRRVKWPALQVDDALEFELRGKAGARFHRLVQQYLVGIPETRLSAIAQADPDPETIQWWENFMEYVPPHLDGERHVERSLNTYLGNQRLVAKYDLILVQDDTRLVIFDWKTARKRPRKAWLKDRVQTRLYRYLLAQSGGSLLDGGMVNPEHVIMKYWFAPHPEVPVTLPYDQQAYEEDETYLEDCIQEILDCKEENFFRTEDIKKCQYCVYRSHCDRGVQAGNFESFEGFEMDEEDFELDLDFEQIGEIEF